MPVLSNNIFAKEIVDIQMTNYLNSSEYWAFF